MFFPKVPAKTNASAFLRLRVIADHPKPALTLVTKRLELSYQVGGAGAKRFEACRGDDAALRITLDEPSVLEIGQQRFGNPNGYASRE